MSGYVVAGATGRVGSVVVRQLLDRGTAVTAITRSATRAASLASDGVGVAVGSLADESFLTRVLSGADGFFVLLPEPFDATDFHGERRAMADTIAAAVAASNVPRVVMLSSLGAHLAEGVGPITDLHYLETRLRTTGAIVTAIRSSMFQDNIAMAVEPARQAGIFANLQPSHDVGIPMTATRDVGAMAARELLATPDQSDVLDVVGPSYSPQQVATALTGVVGRTVNIADIPAPAQVSALTEFGLPPQIAEAVTELQAAHAAGRIVSVGDRREHSATSLADTLAAFVVPV